MSELYEPTKLALEQKIMFIEGGGWNNPNINIWEFWEEAMDAINSFRTMIAHKARSISDEGLAQLVVECDALTNLLQNLNEVIKHDANGEHWKDEYIWCSDQRNLPSVGDEMERGCDTGDCISCFLWQMIHAKDFKE
jgi:hypothetical protein